jgi:hypothetical protein
MAEPRVPGTGGADLELPCGRTLDVHSLDLGMRELTCSCGEVHAVVMDPHPLSRWVPEFLVEILRETVETADDWEEFGTAHVMGMVLEEFPERVAAKDVAEDGHVGASMVWVTDFDSRRLHEVVVELLVELMEHAVSHAENGGAMTEFEAQMLQFDVGAFVEEYRRERDFADEFSEPV